MRNWRTCGETKSSWMLSFSAHSTGSLLFVTSTPMAFGSAFSAGGTNCVAPGTVCARAGVANTPSAIRLALRK